MFFTFRFLLLRNIFCWFDFTVKVDGWLLFEGQKINAKYELGDGSRKFDRLDFLLESDFEAEMNQISYSDSIKWQIFNLWRK